ncbi:MAG: UTP--glucose-1-phosphate uridylyltransferase GalU [Candidatus Latescibacteria bacterium]|nr:UTP--glucose-1-phosphate uridylyltransferase GalU [Candidatus Latescibacterota bacterium]
MVTKAVIPSAGLGTRFLPATKAQPKEMLPIIDTPVIQYVVQEAVDSGIEDILIITGKGKRALEDHFDRNFELEEHLKLRNESEGLEEICRLANMADIHFIRQKEFLGLGDAIRYARHHTGEEPFAVLLGDTIFDSGVPVTRQLIEEFENHQQSILAVEEVPPEKYSRYGMVGGRRVSDKILEVEQLVEKPGIDESPSSLAAAGRYILTPGIFEAIEMTQPGKNNEIQLTDALRELLNRENILAFTIEGRRFDIGDKLDYLKANIDFALRRDEFAEPLLEFLRGIPDAGGGEE